MMKRLTVPIVACAAILVSCGVQGQDVLGDLWRERVDEHRLRHDYRVLHRDMAHGNSAAVQYDMMRIRQDQAILARDQAQLNYDRSGGRPVSPFANNPGSYPSGSGLGYPYPIQPPQPMLQPVSLPTLQPVPQPLSQLILPPVNPPPVGAGLVPPNPLPGLPQIVVISNPPSTGVTLIYIFGGQTYSIDSGRTQEFAVTTPMMIVFNRGGQAGVARLMLTAGNTFEFKADSSGWFMVKKLPELVAFLQNSVPPSPSDNLAPAPAPETATTSPPPLSPAISPP